MSEPAMRGDPIARMNAIHRMFGDANVHVATTAFGRYRNTLLSSGLHTEDLRIEDARGSDYRRDRRLIEGMRARVDELQRVLVAYKKVTTPEQQKEAERIAKVRNRWPELLAILQQRWPLAAPTNQELARLLRVSAKELAGCEAGTFQLTEAMLRRLANDPIPPPRTRKRKPKAKETPNASD